MAPVLEETPPAASDTPEAPKHHNQSHNHYAQA
jgi:hypothetical protein